MHYTLESDSFNAILVVHPVFAYVPTENAPNAGPKPAVRGIGFVLTNPQFGIDHHNSFVYNLLRSNPADADWLCFARSPQNSSSSKPRCSWRPRGIGFVWRPRPIRGSQAPCTPAPGQIGFVWRARPVWGSRGPRVHRPQAQLALFRIIDPGAAPCLPSVGLALFRTSEV